MLTTCAFCKEPSTSIGWDETSHLGKRPICYKCIGLKDIRTMKKRRSIILYYENNKLWNLTKTLSFDIITQTECGTIGTYIHFIFLVNKKKWIGVMYGGVMYGDRVLCRKA